MNTLRMCKNIIIFLLFFIPLLLAPTSSNSLCLESSTPEDRAALFEYILEKTMLRESFSPIKNKKLGLDVKQEMLKYREELIAADTDEKLYYALAKISNARKDRHLKVSLVQEGLALPDITGVSLSNYPEQGSAIPHAPILFAVDYEKTGDYFVFVGDIANNLAEYVSKIPLEIGDKLLAVNGRHIDEYRREIEPYHRYSTLNGFWWKFASWIPQKSFQFPPSFYQEDITFRLENREGKRYTLTLPYLPPEKITWEGKSERRYPGFREAYSTQTYDLYRRQDNRKAILIVWHGFREDLVTDIDRLMAYAASEKILDHAIIFDATRSRGGSKGAYAIQRLTPLPFKTTFGNLKLSDITPAFIAGRQKSYKRKQMLDSGVTETIDDGTWLMAWLEDDVTQGLVAGQSYSNNVPFKLAHAPKYSDGILKPAELHFHGPLVCLFSPHGGSHLDQFASIIVDNSLGTAIGMPCGGYSNTWEWEETLVFPLSKKPVLSFMWSIGHTLRPNGEILEGNPADMDVYIPVTRDNYFSYSETLLTRAMECLDLK